MTAHATISYHPSTFIPYNNTNILQFLRLMNHNNAYISTLIYQTKGDYVDFNYKTTSLHGS
jgi:hypothetical protein